MDVAELCTSRLPGNGAATGLLVKDFRGKDANQVIWEFDSVLEEFIRDSLKQAAIEEGQWTEKRDHPCGVGIDVIKARLNASRQRVADAKKARDGRCTRSAHADPSGE